MPRRKARPKAKSTAEDKDNPPEDVKSEFRSDLSSAVDNVETHHEAFAARAAKDQTWYTGPNHYKRDKAADTPLWERDAIAIEELGKSNVRKAELGRTLHRSLRFVRVVLMMVGQYPLSHSLGRQGSPYTISWKWLSWNAIWFCIVSICVFIGFLLHLIGIVELSMRVRYTPPRPNIFENDTTKFGKQDLKVTREREIVAAAMMYRHALFIMHVLMYTFLSILWSGLFFYRRHLWVKVFNGIWRYSYDTGLDFTKWSLREALPYFLVLITVIVTLIIVNAALPSAQSRGCPTLFFYTMFHFVLPDSTFTVKYVHSANFYIHHTFGTIFTFIAIIQAYLPLILYFWCMAVMKSAWTSWNQRMHFHLCRGDEKASAKERTTYDLMYWDGNRLLDLTCDMDEAWSLLFEVYLFFFFLLLCFENGFTIKVGQEADRDLTATDWGQRIKRPDDYRSAMCLAPLNMFALTLMMFSACWATDAAGGGYDIMRRKAFLDGLMSNSQVFFTTGLIQMYSVARKVGFEFGRYVDVSRSNFLVLMNLIITTSVLVYQLNLQNDMDTRYSPRAHFIVGNYTKKLEGLKGTHNRMAEGG